MSFGQPLWFCGLALLPLLVVLYARHESRRTKLLRQLVAARLLDRLAGTVHLPRRRLRFALFLLGLAALIVSLAQPRYGYTWEEAKHKGRDVIIAIDCSRSMLATDLLPSRLARAKLATQDLIEQLPGDRVGLIAFAGTAFLQAPLTIDYGAVLNALEEFNTDLIPRGGTNIAAAITEADAAFGKGESDNRCLILFTDGEELEADALAAANAEKDHMRIFTVGLGSADGSLIPIPAENGGTTFVKDENGQFVKSRLDEDRLRKIAEMTGGFYVHLQSGPAEMKQIIHDGLGQMKEKEFDTRLSRRPIERYQWPLSAALVLLVASTLIGERKRPARRAAAPVMAGALGVLLLLLPGTGQAKNSGLEAYDRQDYQGAITEFDRQLQQQRDSAALNFDLGAAAYKAGDLDKALEAFAKAITSPDPGMHAAAEYNLGNTLFQQGVATKQKEGRVRHWKDALQHYEQALNVTPQNADAQYNRDLVKKLLEDEEKQPPKSDQQKQQDKKDDQKKDQQDQQKQQQQQSQQNKNNDQKKDQQRPQQSQGGQQNKNQDQQQQQQQQSQSQQSQSQQQQSPSQQQQSQSGQQPQQNQQGNAQQDKNQDGKQGQQDKPQQQKDGKGEDKQDAQSNPSQGAQQPQPQKDGQGEEHQPQPNEPDKKFSGEVGAQGNPPPADPQQEAAAEAQAAEEGKMTASQAKALLESLKGEDKNVRFSTREGKPLGRAYRDW